MLTIDQIPVSLTAESMLESLRVQLRGELHLPDTPGYDAARKAWVAQIDQRPALIVVAHDARDIAAAVKHARVAGLSLAVQATGHGGIAVTPDTLLIVTVAMTKVTVDAGHRLAYVQCGAKWGAVLAQTQAHGLAPLLGSTTDVGAVGYTLGGGFGWLGRKHGLAADSVVAFEVITADGEQRRTTATDNPDLFWALRGGGGAFAIVSAMTIQLYPVTEVYAGNLLYPASLARDVMRRWRDVTRSAPDELSTSVVLMNYPPVPALPDFLRGQSFVIVRGCYSGELHDTGRQWTQSWRDWRAPVHDFWGPLPFTHADMISQDPVDPMPAVSTGTLLNALSDDAIDALIAATAPGASGGPPAMIFAEVRLAGGAISRVTEATSPIGHRDAAYSMHGAGVAASPSSVRAFEAAAAALMDRLAPVRCGVWQNFVDGGERQRSASRIFSTVALRRLAGIKAKYDPDNLLRHSVRI